MPSGQAGKMPALHLEAARKSVTSADNLGNFGCLLARATLLEEADETLNGAELSFHQGLKPRLVFQHFAARLKSCPPKIEPHHAWGVFQQPN